MYFLDQKANVAKSKSYPIALEGDTKGNKVNSFTIFIDWDQDGYFTGEDETYFVGTLTNSTGSDGKQLLGTLNIPSHAKLGETRMRVVKLASPNVSFYACGSGSYNGQVHDYTLIVNDFEFCNPTFTSVSPITSVKIADLTNTSSATSTVGVESFKDKTVTLEQGGNEQIEIKGNTNGNFTNAVTVFVDWNKNGVFGEDEIYQIGKLTNSTGEDNTLLTNSIAIPQNARLGKTTMRVVMSKGENYATDICSLNNIDGQIEDYSVNIITGNCIKATTNDYVENGHANVANSIIANDFKVEANHSFELAQVKFDFLVQSELTSANVTVYENNNGQPGNIIYTANNVIHTNMQYFDTGLGSYQLARYTYTLPQRLNLEAGAESKTYWIGVKANATKSTALSATATLNSDFTGRLSQDGGATWLELPGFGNWDGVLTLVSNCGLTLSTNDNVIKQNKTLNYYPNPVDNILTISNETTIKNVEVYNMAGQKVFSKVVDSKTGTLNLSKLKAGVYVVKADSESFRIIKK